ncbi:MAG: FN3 associated domain-containing protein [Prevotella sp.]|nr:FN3 associated domain-containing protein [Prevotella sp.]MDY5257879.1 FN3 associated domain-containing protein [Prevotella sp.]
MSFAQTTVTFTAGTDKGPDGGTAGDNVTLTKDDVTLTVSNGVLGRTDNYRVYKGQTLTVSSAKGNITKVVFTCTASGNEKYGPGCFEDPTPGSYTYEGTTGTWTGDAASFTLTAKSNQVRATKIEVTLGGSGTGETVAAPTISGETPFKESTTVTITGPENSLIYYTTDGQDPDDRATQYTAPFTLDATTTVKAIAYVGNKQSTVATKEFVKAVPAKAYTVAEALQLVNGGNIPTDTVEVKGIVSTYNSSQNANLSKYGNLIFYISDDGQAASELEAYACYDLNKARFTSLDQLALGDTVIVRGILKSFNGKPELDKGCYLTYHGKVVVVKEYTDATVAEANAFTAEKNYVNLKFTNATVAYVDGDYAYVREGGKAIILQGLGIAMKQGQTLNGSVKGNFTLKGGLIPNFLKNDDTNADNLAVTGDSTGVDPVKCTVAEIVNHKADYIVAEGTITSEVSGKYTNYYINDAEGNKVQIYGNIDVVKDAQADTKYSLEALVNSAYNKAVEIRPIKLTVVTGINDIKANAAKADNVLYNLAGQRVSAAYKGVVISNGKKFYNK